MKKLDLGQVVSIVANLGVIAGIVFLGYELRQNNSLLEAEARATSLAHKLTITERFTDPQVAALMAKVSQEEELSLSEKIQLSSLYDLPLELWEWTYTELALGQLDTLDLDQLRLVYQNFPGFAQHWQDTKQTHPAEFRQWYDENIASDE